MATPRYGYVKVGDHKYMIAFDGDKAYFDAIGSPDGRNAAPVDWKIKTSKGPAGPVTSHEATLTVDLPIAGQTVPCTVVLYEWQGSIGYYLDFAMTGTLSIGEKNFKVVYEDPSLGFNGKSGMLVIDEKGDGKIGPQYFHPVGRPFMLDGKEYEFGSADGTYAILPSTKKIEAPPAYNDPNDANGLKAGSQVRQFKATTMTGEKISFPGTFKGKVVMLDFWATWCNPCMREVPNVVTNYKAWHDKGFEVLGVSLDRKNSADQVKAVASKNGMTWEQVYDGNYFSAAVAKLYGIQSIPEAYIVDGDTGKIYAHGEAIRGDKLGPAIEKALAAKRAESR